MGSLNIALREAEKWTDGRAHGPYIFLGGVDVIMKSIEHTLKL